jgi:hypothetical protein
MAITPKQLLFNDGEALSHADLNDLQKLAHVLTMDGLVRERAIRFDSPGVSLAPPFGGFYGTVYAPGDGAALIYSATTRNAAFRDGMIAVAKSGSPAVNGITPSWDMYWAIAAEMNSVRPAATTNPRWDILTVQLTAETDGESEVRHFKDAVTGALTSPSQNKRRSTTAVFTWTMGTEAASPVEPSIPAGGSKIASVMISPAMGAFDPLADPAEMRDYRVPFGVSSIQTPWELEQRATANGATVTTINGSGPHAPGHLSVTVGGGTERFRGFARCPFSSARQRVYGWTCYADITSGVATDVDVDITACIEGLAGDINTFGAGTWPSTSQDNFFFQPDGPLWANGYQAGVAAETAPTLTYIPKRLFGYISIDSVSVNMSLYYNRWIVKGP